MLKVSRWLGTLALLLVLTAPVFAQDAPPLRIGVADNPGGLDPAIELSNVGTRVIYSLYDTLVRRDFLSDGQGGGSELVPMLAESWERLSDTVLEVRLRPNVVFHNGEPLTAEDVAFTFERIIDPENPYGYTEAVGYFENLERVDIVDASTLQFVTEQPDPILEHRLASWAAQIVPKAYFEEVGQEGFAQQPIGTGPYRFVEMRPDERIVYEAFDEYWAEPAPASTVTFAVIPELSGRVTALINGEVDIITNVPPDQIEILERYDHVGPRSVVLANTHVLVYNTTHPVLEDKRVRQALNLAVDRQLLVDALWNGRAVVPNGHQYPEFGELYNPDRPQPSYDPERAQALLEEAGYNGETIYFRTHPTYYTNGAQAAQAIVEMWRAAGVNAEVVVTETVPLPVDDPQMMVRNWSNSAIYPDFDGSLFRTWGPRIWTQTQGYWLDPQAFNEMGERARTTLDTELRYRIYQEMLDMWEDEAPGTILYQPFETYGVRADISWQPYSFYFMDLRADNLSFE